MKKIAYFVMLWLIALVMQSCETNLDPEMDNVNVAMKGDYSLMRTYMFANSSVVVPLKTVIPSSTVSVSMVNDTVMQVNGILRCEPVKPAPNGAAFYIPEQLSDGITTYGIDSIHIKGVNYSGCYASTTKTMQMWYWKPLSEYSLTLNNEVFPIVTDQEWDTFVGYLEAIIKANNAQNGITGEVHVSRNEVNTLIPNIFTKVIIKDTMRMVSKQ